MIVRLQALVSAAPAAAAMSALAAVEYGGKAEYQRDRLLEYLVGYLMAIRDLPNKYPKDPVKASVEAYKLSKLAILGLEYREGRKGPAK